MSCRRIALGFALGFAMVAAAPVAAQLRPLEPIEWSMFDNAQRVAVELGAATYWDQRVSRAGTEGTLVEAGRFRAFWRTGSVLLEATGTVRRYFHEDRVHEPLGTAVDPAPDGWRRDSGDYVVTTTVRLTPAGTSLLGVVRFGTRLPTTDNREGLERDRMDFFALAGGRLQRGPLLLGAEAGVSINGTREEEFEQKDVLAYMFRAEYDMGAVTPMLTLTGDVLGPRRPLRGNEPLGELRLGLRTGGRNWIRFETVAGYREFSPRMGIGVSAGVSW
jgi:hypothetical protein